MSFRRVFVSCALIAFATVTFSASARVAALANPVSTAAAVNKAEQSDVSRVRACRMMKAPADGIIGPVGNMSYAIRRFSVAGQLGSCAIMAITAATYLDLERTGQTTFAALTSKIESESGGTAAESSGLSLAESARASMSADQLGRYVYTQCSSNAEIQ